MRSTDTRAKLSTLLMLCITACVLTFNVDIENRLIFKGPNNSYFGFSVAILENDQGTWLLVGAPRANDSSLPNVTEPGAVFQCNWQYRSSCQPVFIDNVGNDNQTFIKWKKNITVHHRKDNQWLGASIDVNVHGDSHVMICAPRWVNQKFSVQGMEVMNGLCYESSSNLNFDETSAWPVLENWKKQVHTSGYYSYGMGSLGTSAVYSHDGEFAVLGAPGLNDWAGGFAFVESDSTSKPNINEIPTETDSDSYFGMSVTTARLSAQGTFTIVGGPRAGGHGKVYAYNNKFQLLLAKEGSQLGSYFGASVCAVDLNGDELDDLVVGAPLYSDSVDEGRVYVYINREFFNLELLDPLLVGSNTPGARFGTAVANLGDLNLDRYGDIAVGAPYEEESGVVYIYNGAKSGIYSEPSQRIVGKSLGKDLLTFGWSFSRPFDVDGNHYQDFAVGAFESNKVVLLRTRSVLDLHASLEVNPALIDMTSPSNCHYQEQPWHCVEATVCLRYTGRNLPPSSEVNITLRLDTLERHRGERGRLFIQDSGSREADEINELVVLRLHRDVCTRKYTVYVRPSRDMVTPLQLELEYDIAVGIASSCTICPIRNKYNPKNVQETVFFALECGDDHFCKPDLNITVNPIYSSGNEYFMIDDTPYFDLEIAVTNSGEISYLTIVTMDYPSTVYYSTTKVVEGWTSVSCDQATDIANALEASLRCDIMTPVKQGEKVIFTSRFYAYGIAYNVQKIEVKVSVSSVGKEHNKSNDERFLMVTIPVQMRTEMKLTGVSIPHYLSLPREVIASDTEQWFPMSHLYILRNFGPSPMPHGQLTLFVPDEDWLKLVNVQTETKSTNDEFSHVPVECSMTSNKETPYSIHGDESQDHDRQQYDLVTYVNCNTSVCYTVTCYLGHMRRFETVYINVSIMIRMDVLQVLKVDKQLSLTTMGVLKEPDYVSYRSLMPTSNVTATTYIMYRPLPKQVITWWVLVISISSGLLLLYIVAVIMWKCGFFRRKQKEELQMLLKSSEAEREILHLDSLSAGSSDVMVLPHGHSNLSSFHSHHESRLFFYPHLEPNDGDANHNFDNHNFFPNHSLNRRDINHGFSQHANFHTLQYNNHHRFGNHRNGNISFRSDQHRHNQHRTSSLQDNSGDDSPQPNIWLAPPAASTPAPSFNNEMYLEPLESRA